MVIAAVVVVALGVTVGVVIPRVIHSQRVAEYTELVEELRLKMDELAEAETALQAATALTHARHSEALLVANAVAVLGETQEPILPAEQIGRASCRERRSRNVADTPGHKYYEPVR